MQALMRTSSSQVFPSIATSAALVKPDDACVLFCACTPM